MSSKNGGRSAGDDPKHLPSYDFRRSDLELSRFPMPLPRSWRLNTTEIGNMKIILSMVAL